MGFVDVQRLQHVLPDGRVLFNDVSFRVGDGGQQARVQVLLLELSGCTLLLDEPTDNLDLDSAEALEEGLEAFDETVIAVTTTAGSPVASTRSWCSGRTARSTSHRSRCGTRVAWSALRRAGAGRPHPLESPGRPPAP